MPRIDMILTKLIDDVNYAKRTFALQKTFNQIRKD